MYKNKLRTNFFLAAFLIASLMPVASGALPQAKKGAKPTAKPGKPVGKQTKAPVKQTAPAKGPGTSAKNPANATKTEIDGSGKPSTELVDVTAPDALEKIRALTSQTDRINALEKFIVTQRGSEVQQAKEQLMREYTLRGEQHLREGSPQNAAKDFSSVLRLALKKSTIRFSTSIFFRCRSR
jgi:hypothetical protein